MRKYGVVYSNEIYNYLRNNAANSTIKELIVILKEKFGLEIENKRLAQYCIKMGINYKYEKPNKSHDNKPTPVGVIVRKTDGGMLKIKVGNHKWEYLQREIYEQHYGVNLKDDEYVIFLDHNRRNFKINNLRLVTRQESAILSKEQLYSENPIVTETGLQAIKLRNKIKEKEGKIWHKL